MEVLIDENFYFEREKEHGENYQSNKERKSIANRTISLAIVPVSEMEVLIDDPIPNPQNSRHFVDEHVPVSEMEVLIDEHVPVSEMEVLVDENVPAIYQGCEQLQ